MASDRKYEMLRLNVNIDTRLFKISSAEQTVWIGHGGHVIEAPETFQVDATIASVPIAAISQPDKALYGVQFHPEIYSEYGSDILKRFVFDICECQGDWTIENFIAA